MCVCMYLFIDLGDANSVSSHFWGQFLKSLFFPSLVFVPFRKRNDTGIQEAEKKRNGCQEILSKLQQQYQQFLTKAAAKA